MSENLTIGKSYVAYDPREGLYREISVQLQMLDNMKRPLKAAEMITTIPTEKLACLLRFTKKQLEQELRSEYSAESENG